MLFSESKNVPFLKRTLHRTEKMTEQKDLFSSLERTHFTEEGEFLVIHFRCGEFAIKQFIDTNKQRYLKGLSFWQLLHNDIPVIKANTLVGLFQ